MVQRVVKPIMYEYSRSFAALDHTWLTTDIYLMKPFRFNVHSMSANFAAPGQGRMATIDIAVETLRVAEYLTPLLMDQLK